MIEAYLAEALGYPWDRVHDEAERLEHAASDLLVERMAAALEDPSHDPHGDPIPDRELALTDDGGSVTLSQLEPGEDDPRLLWSQARGGAYMPTPLLYRGLLYVVHHNGRIVAYDARSGAPVYKERFSRGGTFTSSPVAVNGKLYLNGGGWNVLRLPELPHEWSFHIGLGIDVAWHETNDPHELTYADFAWEQPIGSDGFIISAFGYVSRVNESLDGLPDPHSRAHQVALWGAYPIIRSRDRNLWVRAGLEMTNLSQRFAGFEILRDRLRVARVRLDFDAEDDLGGITFATLEVSQGLNAFGASHEGEALLSRTDGRPDFTKFNLSVTRHQEVFDAVSVQLDFAA